MTQKRVPVYFFAVLLTFGVSTAWGEATKESSRELLPAPKCCCEQAGGVNHGCCAVSEACPCCAKQMAECKSNCEKHASNEVINKIYPVGRLLCPAEPVILPIGNQELFLAWAEQTPSGPRLLEDCPEEGLINLIRNVVQPMTWSGQGGPGTIDYFPPSQSLVVHQTAVIQEQVADLLAALGRVQEQQCPAAPLSGMPVPPPPAAPPPSGFSWSAVPPMPPLFAERVPPPHLLAGSPVSPPCPPAGLMPPAGLLPAPAIKPAPVQKTYALEATLVQKKSIDKTLNSKVQEKHAGSQLLGVGLNSDSVLYGTIVPAEEQKSDATRVMEIVFCPDPSFRGCCRIADVPGKEVGTWSLQVKATRLKNGKLHLEVINIEGKAASTNDGTVAMDLRVTPLMDRTVKIGEVVKKPLEKEEDGSLRKWVELTVKEVPQASPGAVCLPPAAAPPAVPVPTGMMPMPCPTPPLAYQLAGPGIMAEPVVPLHLGIPPAPALRPQAKPMWVIRQGEDDSSWNLRPILEEGKPKLIVREGDRDSVTVKSLVVKIPGNDPLKLTATGSQIYARSGSLQAHADKVSRTGEAGCFVFEGRVKLTYKKEGELARVTADRVLVNLADGSLEIQDAAVVCPAPPLDE